MTAVKYTWIFNCKVSVPNSRVVEGQLCKFYYYVFSGNTLSYFGGKKEKLYFGLTLKNEKKIFFI